MAIVPPYGKEALEGEPAGRRQLPQPQDSEESGGKRLPERTVQQASREKVKTLDDAAGVLWGAVNAVPLPHRARGQENILDIYDIGEPGDLIARTCSRPDLNEFFPFWDFVLAKQIPVIVNINQEGLSGDYFPDNSSVISSSSITVAKRTSEVISDGCEQLKLKVKKNGQSTFRVTLYKITDWPDGGGYPSTRRLIKLGKKLIALGQPPLIHCQAGLGRSGTLVMVMNLLLLEGEMLEPGNAVAKLAKLITLARADRHDLKFVTTPDQFLCLLRVLRRLTQLSPREIVDQVNHYCGLTDSPDHQDLS